MMQSQRQRELEEARARASQMEKTMKWWYVMTVEVNNLNDSLLLLLRYLHLYDIFRIQFDIIV